MSALVGVPSGVNGVGGEAAVRAEQGGSIHQQPESQSSVPAAVCDDALIA